MKQLTTIYFLIINCFLFAQNLVLNPSFEANNECPWQIGMFANSVSDWSIPNMGSTDFFS
ncbi:hypothetical protein [Winogradskyella sp. PG-2]|uniref:hypothetical protein n=1 Tax=Winogradskyella sp. PG-2 TaxID=754409 RepID=UPI001185FFE1|nr:hypothetical protein [Winogradskyella sp. PG-2]